MSTTLVKVEESAVIGRVEAEFDDFFSEDSFHQPVTVDMSEVVFIEIATMVYLCQFILKRTRQRLHTKLILPRSNSVMVILHTWRFFEVIEELTKEPISNFVEGDGGEFRKLKVEIEGKSFYKDINSDYFNKYYSDKGMQSLVKKGFFSLVAIPFGTAKEKRFALKNQRLQWKSDQLISAVLERNLLRNDHVGNLFANTIIYECLTNAARHPKSDSLLMGSFFDFKKRSRQEEKNYHFTIVLWDNGRSIIDTLRDTIDKGENIRSEASFSLAQKNGLTSAFWIKRDFASKSSANYLSYDWVPTKESENEDLLVSSFFPGISRDPMRKHHLFENQDGTVDAKEVGDDELEEKYGPGLGLTFLLDTAVKDLGGEIAVRTKDLFLNVKNARKNIMDEYKKASQKSVDSIYQAKLFRHQNSDNAFVGNMITIRIPLRFNP